MGPYSRTPKEVARAIRFSGLGVRSVGPVGDFFGINQPGFHGVSRTWICFCSVILLRSRSHGFHHHEQPPCGTIILGTFFQAS